MGPHLASFGPDRVFFPGRSLASQLLGFSIRNTVRPIIDLWAVAPITVFPPNLLDQAARLWPVPRGTQWQTVELSRARCDWITGPGLTHTAPGEKDGATDSVILYFHGGAFISCGLHTHRQLAARISSASGQPVFNVGYQQMPSQPIAESIIDGVEAFHWLLDQGYAASDITLAGDSAGGFLAFAVARAVLDADLGKPAAVIGLSPLLNFDPNNKRTHRNAERCATFPLRAFERLADVADQFDLERGIRGKRISPVDMPLDDLPRVMIQVGSQEVLLADAEEMAEQLASASVPCELQIFEGQVHVFQAAALWVPEARTALAEIGEFVKNLKSKGQRRDRSAASA